MRFLHNKSKFIIVCSSYNLGKQLSFSDNKIHSFMADDELFNNDMISKAADSKELNHVQRLRTIQKGDANLQVFESWKQLNNLIIDVSNGNFVLNTNTTVLSAYNDDSASAN